ncbi:MAG: glycine--tRNA ligase subunit beta [Deltaproteobacteria bacterium]|nr:MAG: glycine--tRNA ligase subunit beta [Deltaproteobacteria bacterium]
MREEKVMKRDLLVEIGCEEIPAGFIGPALEGGKKFLEEEFSKERIPFEEVAITGTPRRLVFLVRGLSERQEEKEDVVLGPPEKVAFDEGGKPTKAAEGFARSAGVEVSSLEVFDTPRGKYVGYRKKQESRETMEVLPQILSRLLPSLPFRKSMRWGNLDVRFARPVHWILALFGKEVVPFTFGDVESGNFTFGHRFLAPDRIVIDDISLYEKKLEEAFVIVDFERRKSMIQEQLKDWEAKLGCRVVQDEKLLEEVANLVEYPVTIVGRFEEKFLELPREILITTMKENQRYFVFEKEDGSLYPGFAAVSNIITDDMDVIVTGNERVLRARLSDADFYYKDDLKKPLIERVEDLGEVIFQADLGTYLDKVRRVEKVAEWLAERIDGADREKAKRAALLSKADLVTGVVYEFPELQGVMGRDYAYKTGEDPEVAEAVFEHYLPRSAQDELPSTLTGAIVSIADKIDTVCGCFGVGLKPTGTQDPYALRRQTIGILHIIMERNLPVSLEGLVTCALDLLKERLKEPYESVKGEVLEFFRGRLHGILVAEEGVDGEVVDAVLNAGFDFVSEVREKVRALARFRESDAYASLMTGFKRAQNILKGQSVDGKVDPTLFTTPEEKALFDEVQKASEEVRSLAEKRDYMGALSRLAALKEPIDTFFEKVLVMDKDENVRRNRLALLRELTGLFSWFADFSKSH